MKVEVFALCDAATDHLGKLNILGTYDTIFGTSLPVVCPPLVFAARIRFWNEEQGARSCNLVIMDYDGRPVMPGLTATMIVSMPPERDSRAINFILNITGITFTLAGRYRMDLSMGGVVMASLPLEVTVRDAAQGAGPQA